MAIANKYFLEELYEMSVADALMIDNATGVEMYTASLKSHNISQTASETEIKAGSKNTTFMTIKGDKSITVELTDIMTHRTLEALKIGGEYTAKTVRISQFPHNATVENSAGKNTITLPNTPAVGEKPVIYNKKTGIAYDDAKVTIADKKATIEDASLQPADIVFVGSYLYEVEADTVEFKNESGATSVRLELDIPIVDADQNVVFIKKVVFYKASLGEEFTMEGTSESGEKTNSTKLTVMKHPDYDALGFISYISQI